MNKGISEIKYNYLNLPTEVIWNSSKRIQYAYDANGVKLRKVVTDGTRVTTTDYLGGFQYKNNDLQFFPTSEGYVNVVTNKVSGGRTYNYVYNYTDHLGNVRVSYAWDDTESKLKVIEENHYYPFGLKHTGYNDLTLGVEIVNSSDVRVGIGVVNMQTSGSDSYNYKYNGKELQEEFNINLYDYGARNYDPAIGRWFNVDPLAEKYITNSPYTYVLNNPIFFIDPDGMQVEHDYQLLKNGQVKLIKETTDKSDTLYASNNDGSVNKNKSVTVQKGRASDSSVIGDLSKATGYLANFRNENNKNGASIGEVRIGYTNNVNDAVNVFNFLNANTYSNIEFGLMKFQQNGNSNNYLIGTQMEFDALGKTFRAMTDRIGGYDNIIAFYHNHDGYAGSHPNEVGNHGYLIKVQGEVYMLQP